MLQKKDETEIYKTKEDGTHWLAADGRVKL